MDIISKGIYKIRFGEPEKMTPVNLIKKQASVNLEMFEESVLPFSENEIVFKKTNRGCLVELPLKKDEKIYGFGLQLKRLNHTGRKKCIRVNSDPISDTGDSHAPVPFYISTHGYGVLVDTARYVTFYCGSSAKKDSIKKVEITQDNIADNVEELYKQKDFTDNRKMIIDIPVAKGIDIYFFVASNIKTVIEKYNLFCGGGCLPPLWGLGIWYRVYSKSNKEHVLNIAKILREHNMPCDVLGLEPGWHSHSYSCSFQWDEDKFPNHDKMLEELKEWGYKVNLWEHIFVHPSSPMYDNLKEYSGNFEVWEGIVPDLTIDEAKKIFSKYHKKEFVDKGISGFKLDECDNSDFNISNWSFPECAEFPSGIDGEQMHSLLGLLYQDALLGIFKDANKRTYGQVRSSHACASPFPYVLYSDLYDHKDFIRGVVNMGFSGLLWAPEVRESKSAEDLIRRLQTVVFSPQALINAWTIPYPPWLQYDRNKNIKGEILEDYEEIENICREILRLRMSFIPYLYSSFAKYYFYGTPPFRALVMDYPDDENTHNIDDEYMMGDYVLVAPIIAGQNNRDIYLPKGNWYCFWTNKKYEGGQIINLNYDINKIPLFIKEGSLLPLARPIDYISENTCFDVVVKNYGGQVGSQFDLFEDDGFTFDYENGYFNYVKLSINKENKLEVKREGNYNNIKYNIVGYEIIK